MSNPAIATARHPRPQTLFTGIRNALREEHPMARNSSILKHHPSPWFSVYARRQLGTARFLFPLFLIFFGWPFAAAAFIDAKNGVYASDYSKVPKKEAEEERPRRTSHKIKRLVMLQEGPRAVEGSMA